MADLNSDTEQYLHHYQPVMDAAGLDPTHINAIRQGVTDIESRSSGLYNAQDRGNSNFGRYQYNMNDVRDVAKRFGEDPPSYRAFMSDPDLQERYYAGYLGNWHDYLMNSKAYRDASPEVRAQALAASQMGMHGREWLEGNGSFRDANGTNVARWPAQVRKYLDGYEGEPTNASPMDSALAQGRTKTMPPSLGASFLAGGPGALFGAPDPNGYDFGRNLQSAAAWGLALDTQGKSLSALGPLEAGKKSERDFGEEQKSIIATTRALLAAGAPLPVALAAGRNNVIGQAAANDYISPAKPEVVGSGIFGPEYGVRIPGQRGGYARPQLEGGGGANDINGIATKVAEARANGITDTDELINLLPVDYREATRARLEGRSATTGGRGKDVRGLDRLAEIINPDWSQAKIAAAQKTITSLRDSTTQSSYANQRVAADKLLNEVAIAAQNYDKLKNGEDPIYNGLVNAMHKKLGTGNADQQKALSGLHNTLAEQATRVARGTQGAEADIKRGLANIGDYNQKPSTYYAGVQALVDSILGSVNGSQGVVDESLAVMPKEVGKHKLLTPEAETALRHFKLRAARANGDFTGEIPEYKTPSESFAPKASPKGLPKGWSVIEH